MRAVFAAEVPPPVPRRQCIEDLFDDNCRACLTRGRMTEYRAGPSLAVHVARVVEAETPDDLFAASDNQSPTCSLPDAVGEVCKQQTRLGGEGVASGSNQRAEPELDWDHPASRTETIKP